jgi:hypothetical protein
LASFELFIGRPNAFPIASAVEKRQGSLLVLCAAPARAGADALAWPAGDALEPATSAMSVAARSASPLQL